MPKYSLTLEKFKEYQKEKLVILDTRKNEDFTLGFIPKSINIELKRGFNAISKYFLLRDQALLQREMELLNRISGKLGDFFRERVSRSVDYSCGCCF